VNTTSQVTPELVRRSIQGRFNPLRGLTPETLSQQLDWFRAGYLRQLALTMEAIEERDDIIAGVAPKRRKAVARHGFEILTLPNLSDADKTRADRHAAALQYFYDHCECTNALDLDERGSFKLLVRQMMDAPGKRWAAHEILWQPSPGGLTAEFRFVPLWFFERITGQLRFLDINKSVEGQPLEAGAWMITRGDGIMIACAVAWMFKSIGLKDWLIYSEKHGMPALQGKTDAAKDSPEWTAMVDAVVAIASDFSCVTSKGDLIEKIDLSTEGQLPYPPLVERMDRALAILWRGGDLSTLSKGGEAVGSQSQQGESEMLEEDDAGMIGETLNTWIDPWVIRYTVGDDRPLAYVKIRTQNRQDTKLEIEVDKFLLQSGAPLSVESTLERYNRPQPEPDALLLTPPAAGFPGQTPYPALENEAVNQQLLNNVLEGLTGVKAQWLGGVKPFFRRLLDAARAHTLSDADFVQTLDHAQREIPELFSKLDKQALANALEAAMGAGALNGALRGYMTRPTNVENQKRKAEAIDV